MTSPPAHETVAAVARRQHGAAADVWLQDLQALVADVCSRCDLKLTGERLDGGATAHMLGARRAGRDVVLRLVIDADTLVDQAAAMHAWAPTGAAAAVLDLDTSCGAMLLERIRPGRPFQARDQRDGLRLARLLTRLHSVPAPPEIPDATAAVIGRLEEVDRWMADVPVVDGDTVARLRLDSEELAATITSPTVVHCDLSPGNVLHCRSGLRVIDPLPFAGELEVDVANAALCQPFGGTVRDRVEFLAAAAGGDEQRAWTWAQVNCLHALMCATFLGIDRPELPEWRDVVIS